MVRNQVKIRISVPMSDIVFLIMVTEVYDNKSEKVIKITILITLFKSRGRVAGGWVVLLITFIWG